MLNAPTQQSRVIDDTLTTRTIPTEPRRGFWILILLAGFLISPVALFDIALSILHGRGIDKLVLFALPVSIASILLLHGLSRRPVVLHALLFPFYLTTVADLYLIMNYDMRLTSSTISVFLENSHHAIDLFRTKGLQFYCGISIFLLSYAAAMCAVRSLEVRYCSWQMVALSTIVLGFVYCALLAKQTLQFGNFRTAVLDIVSHDRNSPFGIIPQAFTAYNVYEQALSARADSAGFVFGARKVTLLQQPEIYVLVVGESSRRDHWSLFGYKRATTPRLEKLANTRNLIPLQNVVTQHALTQVSVPLILTRRSIEMPEQGFREKSIISAFKEAGFRTFWLSTQQRDQWTGAINRYTNEADHVNFFERRHDNILVQALRSAVTENAAPNGRLFFVLHTQGSHFVFRDRYPANIAAFTPTGSAVEKLIAEYDNSIEYTDRLLSDIIEYLGSLRGTTGLLYLADHGENLYDDSRKLFGHMINNEFDLPIPALLWVSDAYISQMPGKVAAARANMTAPLNTRSAFYTLADLGGLWISDPRMQAESVMSDRLQSYPRLIRKGEMILDYDDWMASLRKGTGGSVQH